MNKFRLFLVAVCVMVIVAFFLSWFRPLPDELTQNPLRMKESLLAEEKNFLLDYVLMRERDQTDFTLITTEGVSGYQMFMTRDSTSRIGKLTQTVTQYLFGMDQADWRIRLAALFPFLALISLWLALLEKAQSRWFLILGCIQTLLYVSCRWLLTQGNLLHLELCLAPGMWLALYGTLALAAGNFILSAKK